MPRLMPMLILLAMGAAACASHAPIVEAPQPPGEAPPDFEDASYDEGPAEAAPGSFLDDLAGALNSTAQVLHGIRDVRAELRDWDADPDRVVDPPDAWPSPEPDQSEPASFSGTTAGGGPLIRALRAPQGRERPVYREVAKKGNAKEPQPKERDAKKEVKPDPKKAQKKDTERGKQKERPVERDRKAGRKPTPRIKPRGNQ